MTSRSGSSKTTPARCIPAGHLAFRSVRLIGGFASEQLAPGAASGADKSPSGLTVPDEACALGATGSEASLPASEANGRSARMKSPRSKAQDGMHLCCTQSPRNLFNGIVSRSDKVKLKPPKCGSWQLGGDCLGCFLAGSEAASAELDGRRFTAGALAAPWPLGLSAGGDGPFASPLAADASPERTVVGMRALSKSDRSTIPAGSTPRCA